MPTQPPSSPSSCWPLSIVPAGPLRALSPNHSGFQWGQRTHVAFYGVQRRGGSRGGEWWVCLGIYGPSVRACAFTPTICSTWSPGQRHADTHWPRLVPVPHEAHHKSDCTLCELTFLLLFLSKHIIILRPHLEGKMTHRIILLCSCLFWHGRPSPNSLGFDTTLY